MIVSQVIRTHLLTTKGGATAFQNSKHSKCTYTLRFSAFCSHTKKPYRGQGSTSECAFDVKRRCLQENSKHSNRVPKLQKDYSRSSARQPSVPLHFVKATKIFASKIFLDPCGATLTKHILGGTRQARRATQEANGFRSMSSPLSIIPPRTSHYIFRNR